MRLVAVLLLLTMLLLGLPDKSDGFTFLSRLKVPKLFSLQKLKNSHKFGDKKVVVITGTSSGLGKQTAKHLLRTGRWHVIGACRDLDKMAQVAEDEQFNMEHFTMMDCDLSSYDSVKHFVTELDKFKEGAPLDRLVCNAAVYQPALKEAKWTSDGHEQQMQINFLSHFLLTSLLMKDLKEAEKARVIMVGSVTGNDNTVGGGGVYPLANLRQLEGLAAGGKRPIAMMDGFNFNGAKGYKDTKMALMMTANMLHEKYHRSTGVSFSSIYPGCIADSPLFREKRAWFRKYFPVFMKYVTGGYVGEEEAGKRLFQVITDPRCSKSGVYWSWNGGPRQGRGLDALKNDGQILGAGGAGGDWDSIYENEQSDKVRDMEKAALLWRYATEVTRAVWPPVKSTVSPCPTLKVMAFLTSILDRREELQRPQSMGEWLEGGRRPVDFVQSINRQTSS